MRDSRCATPPDPGCMEATTEPKDDTEGIVTPRIEMHAMPREEVVRARSRPAAECWMFFPGIGAAHQSRESGLSRHTPKHAAPLQLAKEAEPAGGLTDAQMLRATREHTSQVRYSGRIRAGTSLRISVYKLNALRPLDQQSVVHVSRTELLRQDVSASLRAHDRASEGITV